MKNGKKKEKSQDKLVSIKRLLLSIPAKSLKEVKEISKFFKLNNSSNGNKIISSENISKNNSKSYT